MAGVGLRDMATCCGEAVSLNLGCADDHRAGFVNVDCSPPADVIADLREAWPWPDSSADFVLAQDIFEHLPDKRFTMNELYRVLKPGGKAQVIVPHAAEGSGGFQDPTHCSWWTANDFEYYEKGNFARERFRANTSYGVRADFRILSLRKTTYQGRWDPVVKIEVMLEALK